MLIWSHVHFQLYLIEIDTKTFHEFFKQGYLIDWVILWKWHQMRREKVNYLTVGHFLVIVWINYLKQVMHFLHALYNLHLIKKQNFEFLFRKHSITVWIN